MNNLLEINSLDEIQLYMSKTRYNKAIREDEPLSNLDFSSRKQIEKLLNRLNKKDHITILMVSHDLSFIPSGCKRIIVMHKGKIILDGNKNEIINSKFIENFFKNEMK